MKECDAKSENMIAYRDMYNLLEGSFVGCELRHIARSSNDEADRLANIGSTMAPIPPGLFLERINQRSIKIKKPVELKKVVIPENILEQGDCESTLEQVLMIEPTWTHKYLDYLLRGQLPKHPSEAR